MKFLYLCSIILLCFSCKTESGEIKLEYATNEEKSIMQYDSLFAKKLGADDYGMRQYVMAFLKAGPNRSQDSIERTKLQRGHLDNITRLAEEGKLVLAGPFLDDGELRGIYIFDVKTIEEAELLTKTDPAIQAGSLIMELKPWYGSAGLKELNNIHKKISKNEI
jgi:uncharacterized protein YciI